MLNQSRYAGKEKENSSITSYRGSTVTASYLIRMPSKLFVMLYWIRVQKLLRLVQFHGCLQIGLRRNMVSVVQRLMQ